MRQYLDVRVAFKLSLAAFHTVLDGGNRRPVDDDDVAFPFQTVGNVFTGHFACLSVIGSNGRVCAFRRYVNGNHHDPGVFRAFNRRADAFGVGGVKDNHVDFGGNKVVDLRHLLPQIVAAGNQRDFNAITCQFACFQLRAFGDLHEERVGQIAHRNADGFQFFCLHKWSCSKQGASTERGH